MVKNEDGLRLARRGEHTVGAVQKRRLELLSNADELEGAVFFTAHSEVPVVR